MDIEQLNENIDINPYNIESSYEDAKTFFDTLQTEIEDFNEKVISLSADKKIFFESSVQNINEPQEKDLCFITG